MHKLLQKHGIVGGGKERSTGRKAAQAEERERLAAAYSKHAGKADMLERIAEEMPGGTTAKQVKRRRRRREGVHGCLGDVLSSEGPLRRKGATGGALSR